jgi:cell division protein FtsI (penicillin-binding protein 3)
MTILNAAKSKSRHRRPNPQPPPGIVRSQLDSLNATRSGSSRRPPRKRRPPTLKADPAKLHPLSPRFRLITVWVLLIASMLGLSAKLADLQLVKGPTLKAQAQEQQKISTVPRAARRPMIDRQGNVLAVDQVVYTIYAHPMLFKQSNADIAQNLAPVLQRDAADLLKQFENQETGIKLATDVPEELANRIQTLRLDGLELLSGQKRFYPQQALMSQIVGYINVEGQAQAGLEYSLSDQLLYSGQKEGGQKEGGQKEGGQKEGGQKAGQDLLGNPFQVNKSNSDNLKLQLTLDSRLQRVAQRNLEETVAKHGAKRGTVIVMDSQDGSILAMAVTPSYDPNQYYKADVEQFKNWVISDLYEPGSTFKPINIAIALQEDIIGPNDSVYDEGRIYYDEWPIQNADFDSAGGRGSISITDVMRYSSNVGMVHIMSKLKRDVYYAWFKKLGLGDVTGIELPAEAPPQLKDQQTFIDSGIEAATASFGQGFSLTPIQLIRLQAALANGGKLVTPHLVKGLVDPAGNLAWMPEHAAPQTIFSPQVTAEVLKMMEAVVESGSGKSAAIPGYRIAGKTGTAQKANEFGQYGNGRITSFVGILPVENPRYVVLAVIDEPQGDNAYGSTVAAPLVKSLMETLIVLAGIPPSGAGQAKPSVNR